METTKEKVLSILLVLSVIAAFIFYALWDSAKSELKSVELERDIWKSVVTSD